MEDLNGINPNITNLINHIVKRKMPTIVARAIVQFLNEKRDDKITNELRNEFGFSIYHHINRFHKNQIINQCNCIYCNSLKKYTQLKLAKHRLKRKFYSEFLQDKEIAIISNQINELDLLIKDAKNEKDNIYRKLRINVKKH